MTFENKVILLQPNYSEERSSTADHQYGGIRNYIGNFDPLPLIINIEGLDL